LANVTSLQEALWLPEANQLHLLTFDLQEKEKGHFSTVVLSLTYTE